MTQIKNREDEVLAEIANDYLCYANLYKADLRGAFLPYADLRGAYLHEANLEGAVLVNANLAGAILSRTNLANADLRDANLALCDLRHAKNIPNHVLLQTSILPESGPVFGWKKCKHGVLVQVAVGSKAKRSNATGRKCRAEYVKVLQVIGSVSGVAWSEFNSKVEYRKGEIVRCDKWEEDRFIECAGGIHFFLTRQEAENYA